MNKLLIFCLLLGWLGITNKLSAQSDSLTFPARLVSLKVEESTFDQRNEYKSTHRSFFCRLEDKGARVSPLSLKFRLGSVEYVDQMEYSHLLGRID